MRLSWKDLGRPTLVLVCICAAVTCTLAGTHLLTADRIAWQQAQNAEASRRVVLPQAETFTPLETGYAGEAGGETVGYVFETTARGYGGAVRVMTGIDRTGTVTGVVLLEHGETPGLGANAERASFREQFEQAAPAEGLTVVRYQAPGPGQVEALTGATVTSRAVTAAVNEAIGLYYQLTGEGGGTP